VTIRVQRSATRLRVVRIALALTIVAVTAVGTTVPAHAQTLSVLYEFTGTADGANPAAGLVRDPRGNLYGTTGGGGIPGSCLGNGCGVVFKLDQGGQQTVLHSFDFTGNGWDGAHPSGTLVRDPQGNLYGTTWLGGNGPCLDPATGFRVSCGTVFKLGRDGKETVIYNFTGYPGDGVGVPAGLVRDARGSLYGTTYWGGSGGSGIVFKVDKDGHETVLHSFTGGSDGANPWAGLIRDEQGNLYGTTDYGGSGGCDNGVVLGCGTVFKLDKDGHQTVLYSFTGADGAYPDAALFRDEYGNLYGTTLYGGGGRCDDGAHLGCGTVFKLDKDGQQTVLYSFTGADGACPAAALFPDEYGNLYGTTLYGGSFNAGTVFKLTPE